MVYTEIGFKTSGLVSEKVSPNVVPAVAPKLAPNKTQHSKHSKTLLQIFFVSEVRGNVSIESTNLILTFFVVSKDTVNSQPFLDLTINIREQT